MQRMAWNDRHSAMIRVAACLFAAAASAVAAIPADKPFQVEPDAVYRVDFETRLGKGSNFGGIACGIGFGDVNFYLRNYDWESRQAILFAPSDAAGRKGLVKCRALPRNLIAEFRDIRISRVKPTFNRMNGFELGSGERLYGNFYEFRAPYAIESRGWARTLSSCRNARFSIGRYTINGGGELVYTFALDGRRFTNGVVTVTVEGAGSETGALSLEFSSGGDWKRAMSFVTPERRWRTVPVPDGLLPADRLSVRISCTGSRSADLLSFAFEGLFDGSPAKETHGGTSFELGTDGRRVSKKKDPPSPIDFDGYGRALPGDSSGLRLWGCSSGWKVSRDRSVPKRKSSGLLVQTSANETEAVQLVLNPAEALDDVRVSVGDLRSKDGRVLKKGTVEIRRVEYVYVEDPTDYVGKRGWWPDPLTPQDAGPFAVEAGKNQPFWIRVKPPKGTPKGIYRGALRIDVSAGGVKRSVDTPFAVEVFGFDFPDTVTCETAVGLFGRHVAAYHRTTSPEMAKTVHARYLRVLADAHLSPYDWWSQRYATWKTTWKNREDPSRAEPVFDWSEWDREMDAAGKAYGFNTFALRITCMEKVFAGYRWGTPEHDIMAGKYLKGVEAHLAEKGLLDKAYVYWIDEPGPGAYPHVMKGMDLLRRHAPRLRRMLTATPCVELRGAATIWNPTSPYLNWLDAPHCRAAGDRFWWYVCCDPVAPYASDFLDHAGVDMRTWLWQTWGEKVEGVLLWETPYWNCRSMYPDPARMQNPWMDVASWNGRYTSNGNCDGRILYPPRACFLPGAKDVDEDPVPSMRYDMFRDGIEDYEYFVMLRRLSPSHPLLKVPQKVYRSMTSYSFDPVHMETHRAKLAYAIERLKKR